MQEVAHQILRARERERARPLHPRCKKKRPSFLTQSSSALCVSVALCLCHFLHRSPGAASGRSGCLLRLPRARSAHDWGLCSSVAPRKNTENVRNGAADYVVVLFLFLFFVHQWAQRLTSTTRELACANLDVIQSV